MSELMDLAAKCESATGPDRELDILIGYAIDLNADDDHLSLRKSFDVCGLEQMLRMAESHQNIWRTELPRYTASIDAAMTLVPEKGWWAVAQRCSPTSALRNFGSHNGIFRAEVGDWSDDWVAESDFPALALCAAALRAKASSTEPGEG